MGARGRLHARLRQQRDEAAGPGVRGGRPRRRPSTGNFYQPACGWRPLRCDILRVDLRVGIRDRPADRRARPADALSACNAQSAGRNDCRLGIEFSTQRCGALGTLNGTDRSGYGAAGSDARAMMSASCPAPRSSPPSVTPASRRSPSAARSPETTAPLMSPWILVQRLLAGERDAALALALDAGKRRVVADAINRSRGATGLAPRCRHRQRPSIQQRRRKHAVELVQVALRERSRARPVRGAVQEPLLPPGKPTRTP